jgi:hypothetical protein
MLRRTLVRNHRPTEMRLSGFEGEDDVPKLDGPVTRSPDAHMRRGHMYLSLS